MKNNTLYLITLYFIEFDLYNSVKRKIMMMSFCNYICMLTRNRFRYPPKKGYQYVIVTTY